MDPVRCLANTSYTMYTGQPQAHLKKIEFALDSLLSVGHLARRPLVDYLGDGIYELRVSLAGLQHRLLYFFFGQTLIVVACGFLKNEKKIPAVEIERARWRRADWIKA